MKKPFILLFCMILVSTLCMMPNLHAKGILAMPYFDSTPRPTLGVILAHPFSTPSPSPTARIYYDKTSLIITAPPEATPRHTPRKTSMPNIERAPQGDSVLTSFGLYWQELLPRLTEDWYMFTPIDLSKEGEQLFPLIASNAWIIGQARLTLLGGTLRVDCEVLDGVKVLREFLTFFPDLNSVHTISLPLLSNRNFPFRSPLNIQSIFPGDTQVLMYINNSVVFDTSLPGLSTFDVELFRPWMQDMLTILD